MYDVYATYLKHDGGTKFYETVLIHQKSGPTMLIKRWGKIAEAKTGGGQTKVERGAFLEAKQEYKSILDEKRRMRAGKGQYVDSPDLDMMGYHSLKTSFGIGGTEVRKRVGHYQDMDVRNAIITHFSLDDVEDIVAATGEDVVVEGEVEINEPAPDRGTGWASW